MVYNFKKIDENTFKSQLQGLGRNVVDYYNKKTDRVLVEPNTSYDGGRIYCKKDSWIKRGDIISISDNWYVVSNLTNLASDIYNVGVITLCDVYLNIKLGKFVYELPSVASKYSGNSNVRGIIDDSVEGKLSFITGYNQQLDTISDNPYVVLFGKVWQIGDLMNVNNVMNVYCQGVADVNALTPQIGMSPIETQHYVGDKISVKFYWLNTAKNEEITYNVNNTNIAEIDSQGRVYFTRRGTVNIVATCNTNGVTYISPNITVK